MVVQRAVGRAIGHPALRAARRLFLRLVEDEAAADFEEVVGAIVGRTFLGIGLARSHEFQHWIVCHGESLKWICRGAHSRKTRRVTWILRFKSSEEHTSELQSLMRISYAVFCLKKQNAPKVQTH